jgi:hypothetical protein
MNADNGAPKKAPPAESAATFLSSPLSNLTLFRRSASTSHVRAVQDAAVRSQGLPFVASFFLGTHAPRPA